MFSRIAAALLVLSPLAYAQTVRHVPGDHPTIQTAIEASGPGDLVLVAPGVYAEFLDFEGKAISVIGTGGADQTVIDVTGRTHPAPVPPYAAVLFTSGEGAGSVFQGFTVTGFDDSFGQTAAVYSTGTPTLTGVRITGNRGGFSGGFFGGGTLSGCTIDGNVSSSDGGGVHGDATLVDCVVADNLATSSNGGGIHALPGLEAIRCTITGNVASSDGHSGGGVDGPAVLIDCLIAGNEGNSFGGQNESGTSAVNGALLVDGCTITENVFTGPGGYAVDAETIVDTIVWNNTDGNGAIRSATSITYSLGEGGPGGIGPGTGNLFVDPEFVDPANDDFSLQRTSPCVDAGDPGGALDPDGTRGDMGAFFVAQNQASSTPRFGNVFVVEVVATSDPEIGSVFQLEVTAGPSRTSTWITGHVYGTSPLQTPYGELLVDLTSPRLFLSMALPAGGVGVHDLAIPNDTALIGVEATLQGLRLGGGPALTANAVDFVVGL